MSLIFTSISKGKNSENVEIKKNENNLFRSIQPTAWKEIQTVRDLWQSYPERIRFLMEKLNLARPGLQKVKIAIEQGDTVQAATALISYYKQSDSGFWLRSPSFDEVADSDIKIANQLAEDTVTFSNEAVGIPKNNDQGWQWSYKGPQKDSEFAYSLNGHQYFLSLLKAWEKTKKAQYVKTFDRIMRDWAIHNPLPAKKDSMYLVLSTSTETLDWRDITEVRWRDIEAGQRMGATWPQTFYGFQQAQAFAPATRLLMLASIAEHAEYLKEYHKVGHNWTTMEMNGLALIGLAFPEFKEANKWADYALQVMQKEINNQVYPDGTQTELSTKTQWVALKRFESLAENFRKAHRSVPASYMKRLEDMYNYLAYSMRPDGHQPLNNDSDREDLRPRIMKAAKTYNRPDWRWIATNGKAGQKPPGLPSKVFPWAGIHIMRDGWGTNAQWAFFDAGPFGTGHQHSDKLHLSVSAYGKDLLVDGGRYTHENYFSFDPTTWRGYFRSSFSHNVILIDGHGQTRKSNRAENPLQEGTDYINKPMFDYARGTYSGGYAKVDGNVEHTRAVMYVRGQYWIVVDHIETDRPRELQALWHYAPDLQVQTDGQQTISTNPDEPNLRIVQLGETKWSLQIIKGQTKPVIQGWYSEDYGKKEANSTAIYSTKIEGDATFVWLLMPAKGPVPLVKAKMNQVTEQHVKVQIGKAKEKPDIIAIPLNKDGIPHIEQD